jgi:hypothetical protein
MGGSQLQLRAGGWLVGVGGAKAIVKYVGQPDNAIAQGYSKIIGIEIERRGQAVHSQLEVGLAEDGW